ncbi:MAG: HTTM domain-containing protein, partial [Chitinophagales bacterium]
TAYLFSWMGAFYDLTIAYFLMSSTTRPLAYFVVIVFHGLTYLLFNIGLFPLIMIFSTLVFFPSRFHDKFFGRWTTDGRRLINGNEELANNFQFWQRLKQAKHKITTILLAAYILLQIFLPFRHHLYNGNVLWTEEGYRFSWRVMLVEKVGQVRFFVEDEETQRKTEIINGRHLTLFQEKQMSVQPDFILQFAHFLAEEYKTRHGMKNPV